MARSPKDDPRYNDNTWNYAAEAAKQCTPGGLNERKPPQIPTNTAPMNDNNMYSNTNFSNDIFVNKIPFNVQPRETMPNADEKLPYNNMQPIPPVNRQNYGNAVLRLSNGQAVRVFYDENNQQLIFPMSSQYELFSHNQGPLDMPLQSSQTSHLFTLNQDYPSNNNVHIPSNTPPPNYGQENVNQTNTLTTDFLKVLRDNWEPNSTGTYSPFGQNHPLNHPDSPSLNLPSNLLLDNKPQPIKPENSPKRNENGPLADTSNKKRIVAEVKPMRPSYSDVLVKNTKNTTQAEAVRKTKPQNVETKPSVKANSKLDKPPNNTKHGDENKLKSEKKHQSTISSGSESGDVNTDDAEKPQKPSKKSKNKRSNISRKWSSLDDITNEEDGNYEHGNESQFVFIENQEKPSKKEKKNDKKTKADKNVMDSDFKIEEDEQSQFVFQESPTDPAKIKKKKDARNYHKASKPVQDKKKATQSKVRRNKPGYLGLAQNYLEHWGGATWKALVWFAYLISDICGMSLHLLFDLCTSAFTQTYVSSQAVWRSTKDYVYKMRDNKYLLYIDRKFGHTRFGFWRKLKWFKKAEVEPDTGNDSTKLNANIPLPATGEEAMKRLLACKGKDPYSILGVSVHCTDEEIKRYYRRQAFLVHPDKNQQPGAEEAFKILQHAFDLIGEPERREAYERRALESRHVEAAWSELSQLLAQLHDKMEFAANTIRCTNCGRRHKRVATDRPCYAARYCSQCKIRHSAKEGDIWAESSMLGLLVMYYACMDGAVYQITQWASCQKKNLKQLRPDCHVVQYRIVLGNKAAAADLSQPPHAGHEPNLEEFLNTLYRGAPPAPEPDKRRRARKPKQ
ncbi:dnaJ homolog dnj-5-like isoform X1 [Ostrinia furnacalis]|uniref:dnaJ homolog dnj-5-like isoform X1 n=1 Tax=Ostrinia furnacalis TaxID=93504 RepID=UPI00104055AB|nr:dnaJ homolog dnj-5-like isoform X1 [Ostrinia furnacalis]